MKGEKMYLIGIDIGGTKIAINLIYCQKEKFYGSMSAYLLDHKYEISFINEKRIATERKNGYQNIIERLGHTVKELLSDASLKTSEIYSIGIALPGSVNPDNSQMTNGNSKVFVGKNISYDISKMLNYKQKIFVGNDADCFTFAEFSAGVGCQYFTSHSLKQSETTAVGIILGTGVGAGTIISGKLHQGRRGAASEWGHTSFNNYDYPCYCGEISCVEQILSGPALEAQFNTRIYSQIEKRPSAEEIFSLAKSQDPVAIAVINRYCKNLSKFLSSIINVLDPHFLVLGGGMSQQDIIYNNLLQNLENMCFISKNIPPIYKHQISDASGAIGAALLSFLNNYSLK